MTGRRTYRFARCTVTVDDRARWARTDFDDGSHVHAEPGHDDASLALARELGYDDTWQMSRDHELAHAWLARDDDVELTTMWRVANPHLPRRISDDEVAHEEARVLDLQRRLDKTVSSRPWDGD